MRDIPDNAEILSHPYPLAILGSALGANFGRPRQRFRTIPHRMLRIQPRRFGISGERVALAAPRFADDLQRLYSVCGKTVKRGSPDDTKENDAGTRPSFHTKVRIDRSKHELL
jgi:hypothetical protein